MDESDRFDNLMESSLDLFENLPDWKSRSLNKKTSQKIIKMFFNNVNLPISTKRDIYRKFLKEEVNWIEFYGRCKDLMDPQSVMEAIAKKSIFYNRRMPANTLLGMNGAMKPISYLSIRDWRFNCLKITDLDLHEELNVYNYWFLFCVRLPNDSYTLEEAKIASEKQYYQRNPEWALDIQVDLNKD